MASSAPGALQGSDFYFFTPSAMAKKQLFYFTSVGHFYCDFGYRVKREDYGNFLLMVIQNGRMEITTGGKKYTAKEGDVVFIDCHSPHEYKAVGAVEFVWVHFDGVNTRQLFEDVTRNIYGHPVFHMDNRKRLEKMIGDVIYNMRYERFTTEYEDSLQIYKILIELTSGVSGKWKNIESQKDQIVATAVRYINENIDKDLTVGMIARHVGLSESHLNRKFRQIMNSSPKEYLIRRRMTLAKHLLKTTELPVKEIAVKAGFNSESHFSNSFTAQNGLSPRQFREFPI